MNNDKMNKIIGVLVSVLLVSVLLPIATTSPDISTYDPLADVNRDRVVDVDDLYRVGQAYGSSQTLPFQQNKTVVYVYQLESDPPEVEGARVAIIDPAVCGDAVNVSYTDSSGIASFTLNSNSNYTAIAWSNTTYNYANFTTNEYGEASVIIKIGFPDLPHDWVVNQIVDSSSGTLVQGTLDIYWFRLVLNPTGGWDVLHTSFGSTDLGVFVCDPLWGVNETGHWVAFVFDSMGYLTETGFSPDENGTANVVIYI